MLVDILGVVVAAVPVSGSLMESWHLPHTNLESSHTSRLLLANIVFNQCLIKLYDLWQTCNTCFMFILQQCALWTMYNYTMFTCLLLLTILLDPKPCSTNQLHSSQRLRRDRWVLVESTDMWFVVDIDLEPTCGPAIWLPPTFGSFCRSLVTRRYHSSQSLIKTCDGEQTSRQASYVEDIVY